MKRDKRRPNIEGGRDVNIIHISNLVILKLTLHQYIVIVACINLAVIETF
jgi:hypothetical protein